MADQETKAPIVITPAELVALYEREHARQWNEERDSAGLTVKQGTAYKNPTAVLRALLHLGAAGGRRLVDVFARVTATEKRAAEQEARIAKLETFAAEVTAQQQMALRQAMDQIKDMPPAEAAEATKQLAAMGIKVPPPAVPPAPPIAGDPANVTAAEVPNEATKPVEAPAPATVTPIRSSKKKPKTDQGGAA